MLEWCDVRGRSAYPCWLEDRKGSVTICGIVFPLLKYPSLITKSLEVWDSCLLQLHVIASFGTSSLYVMQNILIMLIIPGFGTREDCSLEDGIWLFTISMVNWTLKKLLIVLTESVGMESSLKISCLTIGGIFPLD